MGPPGVQTLSPSCNPILDIEAIVLDEKHEAYREQLLKLLDSMANVPDWKAADKLIKAFSRQHKFIPTKNALYHLHRQRNIPNPHLEDLLVTRKVRSLSGVLVVTVFTSSHPEYDDPETGERLTQKFSCAHNCYYCPNEPAHAGNNYVAQPRSYLHDEPGVLRANRCGFDVATQFRDRINVYLINGHPIDKIEVLVLGGTWSEYPHQYQEEFIRDLFYAANTTFEHREVKLSLQEELTLNQDTRARIIGITLETRPDVINLEEIARMRSYGCTRLQIGLQHTDNEILEKINRGHGIEETIRALKLLKDNCFKVDIHIMPNLPGATVEIDEKMFEKVINDPDLQADQWKIYPCSVVPWTTIEKWHREGSYVPYSEEALFDLLLKVKVKVKPWVRLNRVIRDIPNQYITGGVSTTNMRQDLISTLKKRGQECRCMRCREVGSRPFKDPMLHYQCYEASGGTEYFISYETPDQRVLYGFCRLRIPSKNSECLPELAGCALIRELHVYGKLQIRSDGDARKVTSATPTHTAPNTAVPADANTNDESKVNEKDGSQVEVEDEFDVVNGSQVQVPSQNGTSHVDAPSQHRGIGGLLLEKAEDIARDHGYTRVAVISGVGVRRYYERTGYELAETFHIKVLPEKEVDKDNKKHIPCTTVCEPRPLNRRKRITRTVLISLVAGAGFAFLLRARKHRGGRF